MRKARAAVDKKVTHLTEDEFLRRHQYCVTIARLIGDRNKEETAARLAAKGQLKAVCDHPEDGFCGWDVTPQKLAEINARLAGLNPVKQAAESFVALSEAPVKRKRGRPRKTVVEVPTYFCVQCGERHPLDFTEHMKFKRGRGRPRKS
jgi:hypothetical protein